MEYQTQREKLLQVEKNSIKYSVSFRVKRSERLKLNTDDRHIEMSKHLELKIFSHRKTGPMQANNQIKPFPLRLSPSIRMAAIDAAERLGISLTRLISDSIVEKIDRVSGETCGKTEQKVG